MQAQELGRRWLEGARDFRTTHWSIIRLAKDDEASGGEQALEKLCGTYWHPLYAFARRKGYDPHDAQDLTQGFFACFLEKHYLNSVDSAKGKFRSFLLAAFTHYLTNEWDRGRTQK